MAGEVFVVGPVLSFRGVGEDGVWHVTALLGVGRGEPIPILHVEGKNCATPLTLLESGRETFLRYDLSCKMQENERKVEFGVSPGGPSWHFTVPGKGDAPRMAYVSCNGFSDPIGMRKLVRPENAVWSDLLCNHDLSLRPRDYLLDKEQLWHEARIHDHGLQRFHLLVMGGDQIYLDSIWEDLKALKQWVGLSRPQQLRFKVTKALDKAIEEYYFGLYSRRWLPTSRRPWGQQSASLDSADAMARIPTIMMWDDHDIFDGWGSYSPEMQQCDLFQVMFRHARRAFWVFQMQHALADLPALETVERADVSRQDPQYRPIQWSHQCQSDPLALPLLDNQPGFSSAYVIGPVALVACDLRTERSRTQIMGAATWKALQGWLQAVPDGSLSQPTGKCQHLILMSSVPVAHPKLSLAEGLLDFFGRDDVLDSNADDLRDHWSHDEHEGERKRLLETLTQLAGKKMLRASIVSGDVHVAAWGSAYRSDIPPSSNWAQIQQFTSSAVVHPSLMSVAERLFLFMLNSTASKVQSIDPQFRVEMMLFPGYNRYVMPARNWLALELDDAGARQQASKLWATWRCEAESGSGFSNHMEAVYPAQ